ncbi:hypothetical protein GCM10010505_22320 [Kitasatospora aburaviensis]
MRRAATACAGARIRARRPVLRPLGLVLSLLAAGSGLWLFVIQGRPTDGAALGLLAAGGWGLGLIPVHADWRSTGPVRRRTGEPAARAEADPPIG